MRRFSPTLLLVAFALLHGFTFAGEAGNDPFVTEINGAWTSKNDVALGSILETHLKQEPDKVLVLMSARHYYSVFQPDLAKLTDVVNRIKTVADSVPQNIELKAISERAQKDLAKATTEGLKPVDDKKRESIHKVFPKEFPGLTTAILAQDSMKK